MKNDKRFKILVAGCGAISRHWLDYTIKRDDCEIVGLVDINEKNALVAVEKYRLDCPIFSDLDLAFQETSANLVYDLTYVTTHIDTVVTSLKNGCDVFGEKPMAFTMEQARTMVEAAKTYKKNYSVMQNRRYTAGIRALRDIITTGVIGKIGLICADIFVAEDLGSIRNTLENPMLQDNAVHSFDQARFIAGSDATTVYCHSFNPVGSKYNGDPAGICIFEMSDGSVFNYRSWMGVEGCHTSWESQWRIIGNKGTVIWDGFEAPYYEIVDTESKNEYKTYKRVAGKTTWDGKLQHAGGLDEMFVGLIEGRPAETDCTDNIKSMAMVFASLESAKTLQKVKVL